MQRLLNHLLLKNPPSAAVCVVVFFCISAPVQVMDALSAAAALQDGFEEGGRRPRDVVNVEVIGLLTRAAELYSQVVGTVLLRVQHVMEVL